jgi:hypothetical protein
MASSRDAGLPGNSKSGEIRDVWICNIITVLPLLYFIKSIIIYA